MYFSQWPHPVNTMLISQAVAEAAQLLTSLRLASCLKKG